MGGQEVHVDNDGWCNVSGFGSQPKTALCMAGSSPKPSCTDTWEIAQAIKNFGALTICPSTGWRGDWWQPQGQAILQSTFEYLGKQGIKKFYLDGFSNGGISIGRLAYQLKDEKGLNGLILIDGFDNGAGIRELGLPVLLLERL